MQIFNSQIASMEENCLFFIRQLNFVGVISNNLVVSENSLKPSPDIHLNTTVLWQ